MSIQSGKPDENSERRKNVEDGLTQIILDTINSVAFLNSPRFTEDSWKKFKNEGGVKRIRTLQEYLEELDTDNNYGYKRSKIIIEVVNQKVPGFIEENDNLIKALRELFTTDAFDPDINKKIMSLYKRIVEIRSAVMLKKDYKFKDGFFEDALIDLRVLLGLVVNESFWKNYPKDRVNLLKLKTYEDYFKKDPRAREYVDLIIKLSDPEKVRVYNETIQRINELIGTELKNQEQMDKIKAEIEKIKI